MLQDKRITSSFSSKVFGEEVHGRVTLVNKHTTNMLSCIRIPLDGHSDGALRSTRALLVTEVVKEGTPVQIMNAHLVHSFETRHRNERPPDARGGDSGTQTMFIVVVSFAKGHLLRRDGLGG